MVQTHGGAGSPGHSLHVFRLHPLARGKVLSKTLHNYQNVKNLVKPLMKMSFSYSIKVLNHFQQLLVLQTNQTFNVK